MIKIVVLGADGQLGKAIRRVSKRSKIFDWTFLGKHDVNIVTDIYPKIFEDRYPANIVINCAAITDVAKCETDQGMSHIAYQVNCKAMDALAVACKVAGAYLIHISTDYVYDGNKTSPYTESDRVNPVNEYGLSKLAGEDVIRKIMEDYIIIRTGWLYSFDKKDSIVPKFLEKIKSNDPIFVLVDRYGQPTSCDDLAMFIYNIISQSKYKQATGNIFHFTNEGIATPYDLCRMICYYTNNRFKTLTPITSDKYAHELISPRYTCLSHDKIWKYFGISPRHWQMALIDELSRAWQLDSRFNKDREQSF